MHGLIRWLGAAFIEYITSDNRRILFDPWTKTDGSPSCPVHTEEFSSVDLILVSHDHFDHVASAGDICLQTNALLGGPDETMKRIIKEKNIKLSQVVNDGAGYMPGGVTKLPWVKIIAVPAHHTSNTSIALGTIIQMKDGPIIYHSGDTSLVAEMEIYARLYPIDVAVLPIYGIATMDAYQATEALRMMKPKKVLPVHFDFCKNPQEILDEFIDLCKKRIPEVKIIYPEIGKYNEL